MKVVLFCGGLGMRIRDHAENVPKPMVPIGYRPILWHVMRYYAHYGHRDFVLCLGHRGDAIKEYFLNYEEGLSNNFVLRDGGKTRELLNSDIHDWSITFVDTGLGANIGERLLAVREHLDGEEIFLANYADGLTDLPLPDQLAHFHRQGPIASFLSVRPNLSYHVVSTDDGGRVTAIQPITETGLRINGGFFILRSAVFDYIREGEELVVEPFQRLVREGKIVAYRYDGFWMSIDTAKDKHRIDALYESGHAPWEVWRTTPRNGEPGAHTIHPDR